jgi:hypothetical protein
VLPAVSFFLVGKIVSIIQIRIAWAYGNGVMFFFAGLGIIVHETGHLIMAMLFGHHINEVRFLDKNEFGQFGFVNHSWNTKNKYQTLGNLFIGVAPMIFITGLLIGIVWVGVTYGPVYPWLYPILAYLFVSFFLGMDLSDSDWNGSSKGLPLVLVVLILISIYLFVDQKNIGVIDFLGVWMPSVFGGLIIFSVFMLVVIFLVTAIFNKN